MAQEPRRMLTPWRIEEGEASSTVRTANGFVVAVTYCDDTPERDYDLRREEARLFVLLIINAIIALVGW